MKKLLLSMFVLAQSIMVAQAQTEQNQSLFETVHKYATAIVNDPKSSEEQIQTNQFKVTALNYITTQVMKRGLKKDEYFFDSQAVNMQSFVSEFLMNLDKARAISAAKRMEVIKVYRDASLKNPLFNDTDRERTYCYVNDKQTFTPFSLDTDWEKAYEQATKNIKTVFR